MLLQSHSLQSHTTKRRVCTGTVACTEVFVVCSGMYGYSAVGSCIKLYYDTDAVGSCIKLYYDTDHSKIFKYNSKTLEIYIYISGFHSSSAAPRK
jgi:hypothetical protein